MHDKDSLLRSIEWRDVFKAGAPSVDLHTLLDDENAILVVTGNAFDRLLEHHHLVLDPPATDVDTTQASVKSVAGAKKKTERQLQLLERVVDKCRVFARMSPVNKAFLMDLVSEMGYTTCFCGDGANDCGALRAAVCIPTSSVGWLFLCTRMCCCCEGCWDFALRRRGFDCGAADEQDPGCHCSVTLACSTLSPSLGWFITCATG